MAEEAFESGGIEEAVAEEQSQEEYNREGSEGIREEDYQERNDNDKSVRPKAESRLEKKLGKPIAKEHKFGEFYDDGNIEEFVQDRELTEEEKESLVEHLKELKGEIYFPNLNSLDGYIRYWKSQGRGTLKDGFKGLLYLIKGFIDVECKEDEDVYEKIARMRNSPILYISGAWEYPMNIRKIEEISGYDIAHIKERKDPDKINDIIEYTIKTTGQKPVLMVFSDGGKSFESYKDKYPDWANKVSMVYAIATSKFDVEESDKVKFIDGKKDRLFIIEKDAFKKTSSQVFKVDGGHTWTCYDPLTIRQMFDIIERTARVERNNFETFKRAA